MCVYTGLHLLLRHGLPQQPLSNEPGQTCMDYHVIHDQVNPDRSGFPIQVNPAIAGFPLQVCPDIGGFPLQVNPAIARFPIQVNPDIAGFPLF